MRTTTPANPTLANITAELASLTGDGYDDILAGMICYPARDRLRKAQASLAGARDRQHRIDRPRHFPPCGKCMRCQRGIRCERRTHADNGCPMISASDRAIHERRRREAQERADDS